MADLIDRISGEAEFATPPAPKINTHYWVGIQRLYALNLFTRTQIATQFGFITNADDTRQATQIADQIDAQSNIANKVLYIGRIEAIFYALEERTDTLYHTSGIVNKSKVFTDLNIVG